MKTDDETVDKVIACFDQRNRLSDNDPEQRDELVALLAPLLLGERDLFVDAVRAACERYPTVGEQLWATCQEHYDLIPLLDEDDEDEDDEDEDDDNDS